MPGGRRSEARASAKGRVFRSERGSRPTPHPGEPSVSDASARWRSARARASASCARMRPTTASPRARDASARGSGHLRDSSSWRRPRRPRLTSAAPTRSRWTPPAQASSASRSAGCAFDDHGRESFVPAGAACRTRPGLGPGTPWYEDAQTPFTEALERLDARPDDRAALSTVLAEARPRDALTLWHLLSKLTRRRAGARLSIASPRSCRFPRASPAKGFSPRIARCSTPRGTPGLGVTSWWRLWKSPGPPDDLLMRVHGPPSPRVLSPERPNRGRERRARI